MSPSDENLPFILERAECPVRLVYSMTINKVRIQTFNEEKIFLPDSVFSNGQLYVAFSKVRRLTDICVKDIPTIKQGVRRGETITKNIMYKEVLSVVN